MHAGIAETREIGRMPDKTYHFRWYGEGDTRTYLCVPAFPSEQNWALLTLDNRPGAHRESRKGFESVSSGSLLKGSPQVTTDITDLSRSL